MASTCAATFSARPWARLSASAWMTLATPAIWAACWAAPCALWPATSTCTSPPQAAAAVTVFRVAGLMLAWSCSAMTRAVMGICPWLSWLLLVLDDFGFVLELVHQGGHVGHF